MLPLPTETGVAEDNVDRRCRNQLGQNLPEPIQTEFAVTNVDIYAGTDVDRVCRSYTHPRITSMHERTSPTRSQITPMHSRITPEP